MALTPREQILVAANRIRLNNRLCFRRLYMRHLHQAVFIVRQHRAVSPQVLEDAGFGTG